MAKYRLVVESIKGTQQFNVDIEHDETLDSVVDEIFSELDERGSRLTGYPAGRRALDLPARKGIGDLEQPNPGSGAARQTLWCVRESC